MTRACGTVAAIAFLLGCSFAGPARAQALTGTVRSAAEGAMAGVLVSAQKAGSPITVTVVTDDHGRFRFPDGRLAPGQYALRIRAIGYDLAGPQTVTLGTVSAEVAIALQPTADLAAQLTNTEWLTSTPGTPQQKRPLMECMSCHTLERIVRSRFTAAQFVPVLTRMAQYANNTIQAKPQLRVVPQKINDAAVAELAAYLATINLSNGPQWNYRLRTLPRPRGRATRVVITEYDLPRQTIAPHDVRTDAAGNIWYSDFVENFLGELDPKTGAERDYAIPLLKPGLPTGSLDLEAGADGNLWLALMFQAGLARFDITTKTFRLYPVDAGLNDDVMQQSMVMPRADTADGEVWTNDVARHAIMRLDLKTGTYRRLDPFAFLGGGHMHAPYGMAADARNDLYFMDFGDENIVRVDAKTGAATVFPTPTQNSRPRRGVLDDRGRLWFAEFAANKLAMFDTAAETFKEWDVPTAYTYPYDVARDKNGELWSAGMASDRVLRFDPQSGRSVEYLLPRPANIRRVFVDNSTDPVTFWAGNNHGAAIIRLEPLD